MLMSPYQITVLVVTLILISGCVYGDDHHRSTDRASAGVYSKAKLKQSITEGKIIFCMLHISMQYTNFDKLLILLSDAAYWNQIGQQLLFNELAKQRINSQAKNIILFLGDGQ